MSFYDVFWSDGSSIRVCLMWLDQPTREQVVKDVLANAEAQSGRRDARKIVRCLTKEVIWERD